MKIKGAKPPKPSSIEVVFPREGGNIVFIVEPVMDLFAQYEKLYPEPKPPVQVVKGGEKITHYDDPAYRKKHEEWFATNTRWLIYQSIKGTPDLEFETVIEDDPTTWKNIETELLEFLTVGEYNILANKTTEASLPSEASIKEAIKVFAHASHQPEE